MPPLTAAESGLGLCRLLVLGTNPVSSTLHPWEAARFQSLQRKVLKYRLPVLVNHTWFKRASLFTEPIELCPAC